MIHFCQCLFQSSKQFGNSLYCVRLGSFNVLSAAFNTFLSIFYFVNYITNNINLHKSVQSTNQSKLNVVANEPAVDATLNVR